MKKRVFYYRGDDGFWRERCPDCLGARLDAAGERCAGCGGKGRVKTTDEPTSHDTIHQILDLFA